MTEKTAITLYMNRKVSQKELNGLVNTLSISLTLDMIGVDTVAIDNHVFQLEPLRKERERITGVRLKE